MVARYDLAGLVVIAAPETEWGLADQQLAFGFASHDHAAFDQLSHSDSSLTTRPWMADSAQSAMLPKTICVERSPGA